MLTKDVVEFEKYKIELKLKNIDLILEILKFVVSVAVSLYTLSLSLDTRSIFNEKAEIFLICFNITLIILLIIVIARRGKMISKYLNESNYNIKILNDNFYGATKELADSLKIKNDFLLEDLKSTKRDVSDKILANNKQKFS